MSFYNNYKQKLLKDDDDPKLNCQLFKYEYIFQIAKVEHVVVACDLGDDLPGDPIII